MNLEQFASVKEYLYSLRNQGSKYGIDRMRLFADALGHPERSYPIIHVAGTNGKGSTCAMLEAMLRANGYTTGLFTSPHLVHLGERIQVNRTILSDEAIVGYVHELKSVAERLAETDAENHPSFFEFMTAMAFLRFAEARVDVGIVETGLGGRLDAGNIVEPEVCVITSVGLDHTAILGRDIATIAKEKAGILKPGIPVVLGHLPEEAEKVVRERAVELDCPVYTVKERFGAFDNYPTTNLVGDYQRVNAATATLALELTQHCWPTRGEASSEALTSISWAGRWDVRSVADGKTLILDASHNAEGVVGFEQNMQRFIADYGKKPTVVIGSLALERASELLKVVTLYANELILMVPNQPRACSFEALEALVPSSYQGKRRRASVAEVIPEKGMCALGEAGDTVVVTGSIYLLGELLEVLEFGDNVTGKSLQDI